MNLWYDTILHYFVLFLDFVRREKEKQREKERGREGERERGKEGERPTHPQEYIFIYL